MTPGDIVAAARALIGTPFRHQGRSDKGLDCAGVLITVARALGVEVVDVDGYSRRPSSGLLEATLDAQPALRRVGLADMQAGDLLLMRFHGAPQHLGIFTGENLIHSYSAVGKVCEHRLDESWRARIVRVYRFLEVSA